MRYLLGALLAVGLLAAFGTASAGEEAKKTEFLGGIYTLVVPGDWWAEFDEQDWSLVIAENEESETMITVFAPDPGHGFDDAKALADAMAKAYIGDNKEAKVVGAAQDKIGGLTFETRAVTHFDDENKPQIAAIAATIAEGCAIVIVVDSPADKAEAMAKLAPVAESFVLDAEKLKAAKPKLAEIAKGNTENK